MLKKVLWDPHENSLCMNLMKFHENSHDKVAKSGKNGKSHEKLTRISWAFLRPHEISWDSHEIPHFHVTFGRFLMRFVKSHEISWDLMRIFMRSHEKSLEISWDSYIMSSHEVLMSFSWEFPQHSLILQRLIDFLNCQN